MHAGANCADGPIYPEIITTVRKVSYTVETPRDIIRDGVTNVAPDPGLFSIQVNPQSPANAGVVCVGTSISCNTANPAPESAADHQTVRFRPGRLACGKFVSFSTSYLGPNGPDVSRPLLYNYTVDVLPQVAVTGSSIVGTAGGLITIQVTNIGVAGAFAADESVTMTGFVGGADVTCNSPTASANSVQCTMPPGTGYNASLQLSVCSGRIVTVPAYFSYQGPTVTQIQGTNSSRININGANFGPLRTPGGSGDAAYIMAAGSTTQLPCTVISIDQNIFSCNTGTPLISGNNYTIVLTVGNQTTAFNFTFNICTDPCLNGGKCVALNVCSCTGLAYAGATCALPVVCPASCQNDGQCLNDGTGNGVCVCTDTWTGTDCSQSTIATSSALPQNAIIGIAVGGGALVIILIVLVVVLIKRKPKRGGKNFIPVEKKDFTKIIYGETLTSGTEKTGADLHKLDEYLNNPDNELVNSVCAITQITEADKIAKALMIVYEDSSRVMPVLEAFITEEVRTTESAGTLFRSNSMVSKMFKFYSRLVGLPYLYETIGPEISELIEEELGLEVDPEKMEEGTDLDEMRWMLMAQSQKLLKQILASTEKCPPQFRQLFAHIKKVVGERFPENDNVTIGGFIFLRFFCPAISSPEAYGIVEEPPNPASRRLLILITKVLQNLSNDVEFGSKEPYMTKLNDFVHANRTKLIQFYDKLIKSATKAAPHTNMPKGVRNVSLSVIAKHIEQNFDKIEKTYVKEKLKSMGLQAS